MSALVSVEGVSKTFVQTLRRFWFQNLSDDADSSTDCSISVNKGMLIKRRTKKIHALNHVSLQVEKGEILGLLGPNGAGKTTLAKIISTLVLPDQGTVKVNGYDVVHETRDARRSLGLVTGGERSLYWKLTPMQNLVFFGGLYGMPKSEAEERALDLLKRFEVHGKRNDLVQNLSTGQRMKVAFARALMHDPKVLILDEYNRGLDPNASKMLRDFIKHELKEDKAIIVMTHSMEVADDICDRLMLINRGKIVIEGTPLDLKKSIPQSIFIEGELQEETSSHLLSNIPFPIEIDPSNPLFFRAKMKDTTSSVYHFLQEINRHGIKLKAMNMRLPTLGDVFQHYTGDRLTEAGE
ncbi:MAG: ABC transporter ATP-binding protein [Methanobacteriota archaeon]|nr:MAG: ABC transporter ATP-binding protein [Euryarchaeota archaeon]